MFKMYKKYSEKSLPNSTSCLTIQISSSKAINILLIFQVFYIHIYIHTSFYKTSNIFSFLNPLPNIHLCDYSFYTMSFFHYFFMTTNIPKEGCTKFILLTIYYWKLRLFQSFAKAILQWVALYLTLFNTCVDISINSCVKGCIYLHLRNISFLNRHIRTWYIIF